jgi:uncharacterized membrane protein YphA (DoxX/SURF4 family)
MSTSLNLKEIERKAFRSVHQDGLWDIYIGGIVLSMTVFAYPDDGENFTEQHLVLYMLGMLVFGLIFWGGKKYLTAPRLGQVKFGPQRQRRNVTMAIVLGCIVLLQVLFVAGTALLRNNPDWARQLGFGQTELDFEHLLVAAIGALFVGPSMLLIAYFTDFPRGYFIACIMSLAVFALIWFGEPAYLISASLLILIPGVVLFIRFLRQHPLPPAEARRD